MNNKIIVKGNKYLTGYNLILKNNALAAKQTVPYNKGQSDISIDLNSIKDAIQQYLIDHSLNGYQYVKHIFIDDIVLMIYRIPGTTVNGNTPQYLWATYNMSLNNLGINYIKVRKTWYDYEADSQKPITFDCFKYKKQLWTIYGNKICFLNDFFKSDDFDIFITKKSTDDFPLNNINYDDYTHLWIDHYLYWNAFTYDTVGSISEDGFGAITSARYTMYDVDNDKFITRLMDVPLRIDNTKRVLTVAAYLQINKTNPDAGVLYVKQLVGDKDWKYKQQVTGNLPHWFTKDIRQTFVEYNVTGLTSNQISLTFSKETSSFLLTLNRLDSTTNPTHSGVWKSDYIENPVYVLTKGLDTITPYLSYNLYTYKTQQKTFNGTKVIDIVDVGDYQLTYSLQANNTYWQQYLSVNTDGTFSIQKESATDLFLLGINNLRTNAFYFNNTNSLREEPNPSFWMATNQNQITSYNTNIEGLMIENRLLIKRDAVIKVGADNYSLFKIPAGVVLNGNENALVLNSNGDLLLDDFSFTPDITKSYYDTVDFYVASPNIKSNFGIYIYQKFNDRFIPDAQPPTIQKPIPNNLFKDVKAAINNNTLNTYNNPFKKFRFKYDNGKFSRYLNIADYTTSTFRVGMMIANGTAKNIIQIYYCDENEVFLASQDVFIPANQVKSLVINDEFWQNII